MIAIGERMPRPSKLSESIAELWMRFRTCNTDQLISHLRVSGTQGLSRAGQFIDCFSSIEKLRFESREFVASGEQLLVFVRDASAREYAK
jgi:hypothetical protein